jgi:hypothetical protein
MKLHLISALCIGSLMLASPAFADDGFNPLGPLHVGVEVGVGIPSPLSGDLVIKYKNIVGANLEVGELPQLTLPGGNGITVSQQMWDASLRLYPFKGALFVGCGIGQQWLNAGGSVTEAGVTGIATMQVQTTFVSPRIGLLHRFGFGLTIGADVGVEIPVSGTTSTSQSVATNLPVPPGFQLTPPVDATNVANSIKTAPIPIIHILQLGYMF